VEQKSVVPVKMQLDKVDSDYKAHRRQYRNFFKEETKKLDAYYYFFTPLMLYIVFFEFLFLMLFVGDRAYEAELKALTDKQEEELKVLIKAHDDELHALSEAYDDPVSPFIMYIYILFVHDGIV